MTNSIIKHTIVDESDYKIVAYPESNLEEILRIMKALKIDCVPIVKHPWKKELLRIMKKNDIENAIKNSNLPA